MTKETEQAFAILYCEYKRRRSFGTPKQVAVFFEANHLSKIDAFSSWVPADINYAIQELKSAGYVKVDVLGDVALKESGIECMESKPKEYFDIVSKFFDLASILAPLFGL